MLKNNSGVSLIQVIIAIIIIIIIVVAMKNKNGTSMESNNQATYTPTAAEVEIENKVKATDELFNKEEFIAWAKDLFITLQNSWMARELETIRTFQTPELFEQSKRQMQGYIDRKQINVIERPYVNSARLVSFEQDGDKDILAVELNTRMIDYIIDENTISNNNTLIINEDSNIYSPFSVNNYDLNNDSGVHIISPKDSSSKRFKISKSYSNSFNKEEN